MSITIENFKTHAGKVPYEEWYKSLDKTDKAIILKRLIRVRLGNLGNCKPLVGGDGVWEFVIDHGPGYRIYFGKREYKGETKLVILLVGGDKSTQTKDIAKAKEYWTEEKQRWENHEK